MINLQEGRIGFEKIGNTYPVAPHITRENEVIDGVPCSWFLPENTLNEDIVVYIHGGAFIFGSIASHAPMASHIASSLNRKVLMIDYRLAPEAPFPAGVNDCVTVINRLNAQYPNLRFGIIGDSAGGNLTMASQLILKNAMGAKAEYAVVISPWVNLLCNTSSYERNKALDIVLARPYLLESTKLYAPDQDLAQPELSPVNGDFRGLSPVLIMYGTNEILEDDSVQLHQQLQNCGVHAELLRFDGQLHVWPFMDIYTPASQQALAHIAVFASKHSLNNNKLLLYGK
jgi:acetyl esterase/lipase